MLNWNQKNVPQTFWFDIKQWKVSSEEPVSDGLLEVLRAQQKSPGSIGEDENEKNDSL